MGKTYMHDLPPPRKVILIHHSIARGISGLPSTGNFPSTTHKCEYTPGTAALSTAFGSGFSHRSSFHIYASSPHRSLLQLHAMIAMTMFVPRGTTTLLIAASSTPRMGWERGSTASVITLIIALVHSGQNSWESAR